MDYSKTLKLLNLSEDQILVIESLPSTSYWYKKLKLAADQKDETTLIIAFAKLKKLVNLIADNNSFADPVILNPRLQLLLQSSFGAYGHHTGIMEVSANFTFWSYHLTIAAQKHNEVEFDKAAEELRCLCLSTLRMLEFCVTDD